jgi:precorrin-6Y C5,15-methyltransferase (decarboxylating)
VIDHADLVVGGARHLAMLPDDDCNNDREKMSWPSPFIDGIKKIQSVSDRQVCVLATGDPFNFGVGTTLARHIPVEQMRVFPSPSAFALACSRMGWDRNAVETLSLHGRPLTLLHAHLYPGARLLLLTQNHAMPLAIARLLTDRGFGLSRISVLEHMGGAREANRSCVAQDFDLQDCADLNTVAVECIATSTAQLLPRVPGLPDDAFEHDGQLTKRAVRAMTLSALGPSPGELLWDVGAGCASVAIEWMRMHPRNTAIAIERREDRLAMCEHNAQALGVPELRVERGEAPQDLQQLPSPDAVFIGGGLSNPEVFERCWSALRIGGRLVANVVTVEGEQALYALHGQYADEHHGELLRVGVSQAADLGAFHGFRPAMPVTQLILVKSSRIPRAAPAGCFAASMRFDGP